MKIHYLATARIPSKSANSLQIVKMCEAISKQKHQIKLIIPNLKNLKYSVKSYYDLKYNFKIIRVGKEINLLNKINNILLPLKIFIKSIFLKCDIVITRNLFISLLLIFINKKHIFEIHDDLAISGNILSKLFKFFSLLNSPSIIKLVFITLSLKKHISKEYLYNKKNFIILPDATQNKKIKKIKGKRLKIGYFGSIYKSRGINIITDLAKLDNRNDYFIYGGTKEEIKTLKQEIRSKNIKLKSQVPYALVKNEILKMDVLLMPYTKKATVSGNFGNIIKFMSPMKMFDYLGASKIILSSDIPALREILISNYNSILVKNYINVNSWKIIINKISFNPNKFLFMRKNALKTAMKNNWNIRAKKMLSV